MKHVIERVILYSGLMLLFAYVLYTSYNSPKIAFVRSSDLINGYQGTKLAQMEFESKIKKLQYNLDTLQNLFDKERSAFQTEYNSLSASIREERVKKLEHLEENINVYSRNLEKEMTDEDLRMTKSVLNQINGFVESYAKDNGYDMVFGTSSNGNILWGNKKYDITTELLDALNANYRISNISTVDTSK